MLPQLQGFLKMIVNPGVRFAVENEAAGMSCFDHYIPPELIDIVVD